MRLIPTFKSAHLPDRIVRAVYILDKRQKAYFFNTVDGLNEYEYPQNIRNQLATGDITTWTLKPKK